MSKDRISLNYDSQVWADLRHPDHTNNRYSSIRERYQVCNNVGGREKMLLRQWMTEAGSGLELEFIQKFTDQTLTSTGQLSFTADLENIHSLLSGRWSLVLRLNSCLYQTPAKGDWWLCLTVDDWDVDKKSCLGPLNHFWENKKFGHSISVPGRHRCTFFAPGKVSFLLLLDFPWLNFLHSLLCSNELHPDLYQRGDLFQGHSHICICGHCFLASECLILYPELKVSQYLQWIIIKTLGWYHRKD